MLSANPGSLTIIDYWLVRNAPEDDVIQQSDLFSQLHRWERLKALQFWTVGLNTHMYTRRANS